MITSCHQQYNDLVPSCVPSYCRQKEQFGPKGGELARQFTITPPLDVGRMERTDPHTNHEAQQSLPSAIAYRPAPRHVLSRCLIPTALLLFTTKSRRLHKDLLTVTGSHTRKYVQRGEHLPLALRILSSLGSTIRTAGIELPQQGGWSRVLSWHIVHLVCGVPAPLLQV